jgi:hypothetical protein
MAGRAFAQTNDTNWPLDDSEKSSNAYRKFIREEKRVVIPLADGNQMILGLQANQDLLRFRNVDSLLAIFLEDLSQIKDTLTVSTHTLKLWYRIHTGERQVRLWQYPPAYTQIQFESRENLLVKNSQDTVIVEQVFLETRTLTDTQIRQNARGKAEQVANVYTAYFKIYFLVNSMDELQKIIDTKVNGKVEKVIADMQTHAKGSVFDSRMWAFDVRYVADNQPSVIKTNKQVKPDQLLIIPRFGMGLVGNSFMPVVGANIILLPQIRSHYGRVHSTTQSDGFLIGWERMFAFGRATDGRLSVSANDFVALGITGFRPDPNRQGHSLQWAELKVSYLIRRQGEYFRPNTFRISTAFSPYLGVKGFQRLRLEPELYFHDFFKRAYPGLRVSLGF